MARVLIQLELQIRKWYEFSEVIFYNCSLRKEHPAWDADELLVIFKMNGPAQLRYTQQGRCKTCENCGAPQPENVQFELPAEQKFVNR